MSATLAGSVLGRQEGVAAAIQTVSEQMVSPSLERDIAKFITQFVVEEIDENTSMEDLQKMMAVALVYRVLVCAYEVGLHGGRWTLIPLSCDLFIFVG